MRLFTIIIHNNSKLEKNVQLSDLAEKNSLKVSKDNLIPIYKTKAKLLCINAQVGRLGCMLLD